jgi:para-aminobenzoate synthetase component 1
MKEQRPAYDSAVATARFRGIHASGVSAVTHDPADLTAGFWAVVVTFEGQLTAVRFDDVRRGELDEPAAQPWSPLDAAWRSSLEEADFLAGVRTIRERIAAGTVYQVNLCRVLSHDLPEDASIGALGSLLALGNPAPYAAVVDVPEVGLEIACASPEAYLVRNGLSLTSRPIKGTAREADGLLAKDVAENVMIVDLVRNDLARVCRPGTVRVDRLCGLEQHPGLVHLVSDVAGDLVPGVSWSDVLAATFPPGSVSGAPKHTAMQSIADLEPVPRGPYCGAIGWLDADADEAVLAVGIRTFWAEREGDGTRMVRFGTGAGITWGSDPAQEWHETRLKAARLIGLASGRVAPMGRQTS